ncbi:hypothetical protein MHK_006422, partial [Candidatus Magnetomorum sp. HK-1]
PQKEHFLFPWEKAYIENEVKRITEEQSLIIRKTEEQLMIEQKRAQAEQQRAQTAQQREQAAQKRAQAEQKRAEEERQKAEKLANVLAKLGISAEEAMKM